MSKVNTEMHAQLLDRDVVIGGRLIKFDGNCDRVEPVRRDGSIIDELRQARAAWNKGLDRIPFDESIGNLRKGEIDI